MSPLLIIPGDKKTKLQTGGQAKVRASSAGKERTLCMAEIYAGRTAEQHDASGADTASAATEICLVVYCCGS